MSYKENFVTTFAGFTAQTMAEEAEQGKAAASSLSTSISKQMLCK